MLSTVLKHQLDGAYALHKQQENILAASVSHSRPRSVHIEKKNSMENA